MQVALIAALGTPMAIVLVLTWSVVVAVAVSCATFSARQQTQQALSCNGYVAHRARQKSV